jgi:hypothetical protein
MRVSFADEDSLSVAHDQKASQKHVYSRFRKVLREGIIIAGRCYEFLGFSHSSLRCHQAWFMAPFMQDGVPLCARDVIRDLGDFTNIHCSSKCAARIGQAFSDTTFALRVPDTACVVENKPNVIRNGKKLLRWLRNNVSRALRDIMASTSSSTAASAANRRSDAISRC